MSACGLDRRKAGELVRRHEQQGVHGRMNDLSHREVRDLIVRSFDHRKVAKKCDEPRGSERKRIRKNAPTRDTANARR
jgi:hypothetical protein